MSTPLSPTVTSTPIRGSVRPRGRPRTVDEINSSERSKYKRGKEQERRNRIKSNYEKIFKLACELAGAEDECEGTQLTLLNKLAFCHEVLETFGQILKDRSDLRPLYKELFTRMCAENGLSFETSHDSGYQSTIMALTTNTSGRPS